ncbi:MAG: 3-phosphoshikimate 1-carboxyvinyltransferase [Muribaculaceae bacterium]|nr:3-phosphoshikimate 1-carboxyvinyltransferase [Muribaculaceae bacterium]
MIQLPPSKSIGARYLVATYFSGTLPADPIFQDNDDLILLQQALLEIFSDEEPIDYGDSPIDVGASGTALRFVTAVCASSPGADYVITGTPRLMQRPMAPLIDLLREAGAGIQALGDNDSGPYRITGNSLPGGDFSIRGDVSSQFISALMLVAPYWEKGLRLNFSTPLVSRPYIEMTSRLMEKFGVEVKLTDTFVEVAHARYKVPESFEVEADWSAASFFYEAASLGAENLELEHLTDPDNSLQGDSITAELFAKLGVESTFSKTGATLNLQTADISSLPAVSFRNCPDLVLPFALACLCRGIKFRCEDVAHLRLKESDRIAALLTEARKLGYDIKADEDSIEWQGDTLPAEENPVVETYDDHRVAMAFAVAALKTGEIRIRNPRVVEKSFIDFWNQLAKTGLSCRPENDIMIVTR